MSLPADRVQAWLRALESAVVAGAPHDDFVSMASAVAHLRALSPDLSGDLLAPASVNGTSGMPDLAWMTRATAEQALARPPSPVSDAVRERSPELAARLEARNRLARHLHGTTLLPALDVSARVRRVGSRASAIVVFDHIDPDGHWVRTRVDVEGATGLSDLGLVRVDSASRIVVHRGVGDVFARHVATPLMLLRAALAELAIGRLTRVSRARVGPFWYPGGPMPDACPPDVKRTLVLHLVHELTADDLARAHIADPLDPAPIHAPRGVNAIRQRRLVVLRAGVPAVRTWLGAEAIIQPFG